MTQLLARLRRWSTRKLRRWYTHELQARYDRAFHRRPDVYTVRYNEVTGPYRLAMRLADGPGMRRRLREGTEMPQRRIFLPLLHKRWWCCDVGAHIGDYTVEMALLVGSGGRVLAYESSPYFFRLLANTVEANGLTNVVTKLAVVGRGAGAMLMPESTLGVLPGRLDGVASSHASRRQALPLVEVPVVRLDDQLERLDAIKIDCEGYEVEVLKGMERLVRNNHGLIVLLEVHAAQIAELGSSLGELAALVTREYRFKTYQVGPRHCICSGRALHLGAVPQLETLDEFISCFDATQ